jgi:CHRD domain
MKRLVIATLMVVPLALASLAAMANGREAAPQSSASPTKITICHKTGSDTNPWRRISVSSRAIANPNSDSGKLLRGHLRHTGDAVVIGTAACPPATATPSPTSTPATRIAICHKTGSATNPYRLIMVSSRAVSNPNSSSGKLLRGHMGHAGDLLLPGAAACPSPADQQNQGVKLAASLRPVAGATGSGSATVTIRLGQSRLCYTLTVSGVANVTAAHIHRASTGAVVVPQTAPTTGSSSGCVTVDKALLRQIVANPGAFYVNVHSTGFPDGQVQGALSR